MVPKAQNIKSARRVKYLFHSLLISHYQLITIGIAANFILHETRETLEKRESPFLGLYIYLENCQLYFVKKLLIVEIQY